jgi:hypothetical protein
MGATTMSMTSASSAGGLAKGSAVDTDWDRLTRFRVSVQNRDMVTAPVFANGRQQIPFQIEIVAEKNGKEVQLTDNQLRRMMLVAYDTGAPLPGRVTTSCEKSAKYEYTDRVHLSDVHAAIRELEPPPVAPIVGQVQLFWVSVDAVGELKVAAQIVSPSGVTCTTNARSTLAGTFDSWVIIYTYPPVVHSWKALTLGDREDVISSSDWDVDIYYITFRDPKLRIVDSIHHNHTADYHFYSWPKGEWARLSSVAYQVGERRTVGFPTGIPSGCTFEVNTRPGQANAARVQQRRSFDIRQRSDFGSVTYFDQFGNSVPAVIAVSSDGNTLHLHSTEAHAFPVADEHAPPPDAER